MLWQKASFLSRLVASSVCVSEAAGAVIKNVVNCGDLKIVDKSTNGSADLQTEADRRAQYCIVQSLQEKFDNKLTIIGEEEKTTEIPQLESRFDANVLRLDSQLSEELRTALPSDIVVWVDPLDGTSEFTQAAKTKSPLLEQITVLIGIAYKGEAVAGVVHQPFWGADFRGRTIWAIRGVGTHGISVATPKAGAEKVVVTTRSHSTSLVTAALSALRERHLLDRVDPVGGAGFKVIRCLEGAAAYVFASPYCKKWDTAAPEAILQAAGGRLTDISGRTLRYEADVQLGNTGGVLATPAWINHQEFVNGIPDELKASLPEFKKML